MAQLRSYLKVGFALFSIAAVSLVGPQTEASELKSLFISLKLVENSINAGKSHSTIDQSQSAVNKNPYSHGMLISMSSGKPEEDDDTEQPSETSNDGADEPSQTLDNKAENASGVIEDQANEAVDITPQPVVDLSNEPTAIVNEYAIGPGDLLSIRVFGEEDLSIPEIRVNGAGAISYPLLGEIKVLGFNPKKLETHMAKLLQEGYLKDPQVTVSVLQYRLFYVRGEVEKPGGYSYVAGLTIQKGIALAGGFTERASKSKISLVRENNPDEPMKSVGLNALVKPGDIITVGESLF